MLLVGLAVVLWADFDRHVELDEVPTFALFAGALALATLSVLVPSRLYAAALRRLALAVVAVPRAAESSYRVPAPLEHVFRDGASARAAIVRAYVAPLTVGLVLGEAIAVLGLVLALGRYAPSVVALPFFALALTIFGVRFPRAAHLTRAASRIYASAR